MKEKMTKSLFQDSQPVTAQGLPNTISSFLSLPCHKTILNSPSELVKCSPT